MSPDVLTATRTRVVELDRLRGLAVGLMLVDHLGALASDDMTPARWIGRLALPLFGLVMGASGLRAMRGRRIVETLAWGTVAALSMYALDLPGPLFLLGLFVARWAVRTEPLAAIALAGLVAAQPTLFAEGFAPELGYWPAGLVVLVYAGTHHRDQLVALGRRIPRQVEPIGRHALPIYGLHLAALAAVFS